MKSTPSSEVQTGICPACNKHFELSGMYRQMVSKDANRRKSNV